MSWQPCSGVGTARERARLLGRARSYFAARDVLAVDTPALAATTVSDPNIASMALADTAYLQTSPEYYMKRLLAAGYPDIYSISRVFRAAERGRRHLPEFTLIEWYRRDFLLADIIDDCLHLLSHLLESHRAPQTVAVLDYAEAFRLHTGLDPANCAIDDLADCVDADSELRYSLGQRRDGWLDLVLALVVAPQFDVNGLTVLKHYPASQAALARRCPGNDQLADRFEVFCGDLELANGYVELTDSTEQSARMRADLATRRQLALPAVPVDTCLLAALEAGLPDCAGVALGLERVHMLAAGAADIRDVVTFA